MNRLELNNLIDKVNDGTASEEELRLYTAYLNQVTSGNEEWDLEFLGAEENVKKELYNRIEVIRNPAKIRRITLWPRIAVAAAVLAVTLGIWLYYSGNMLYMNGRHPDSTLSSRVPRDLNDIAPGKNSAVLTLANGKVINLSDAKTGVVIGDDLKYNDGTEVMNIPPSGRNGVAGEGSRMLTASTPRGGTYQVTLPDGTRVWLNAESKISFPSQFSGKERKILLSGEAYFEVATAYTSISGNSRSLSGTSASLPGRRTKQSFIVESKGQQVEVLGTHFNITAYKDETSTKTTLLEGSVRIAFISPLGGSLLERESSVVLKPNEQSTLARAGKITVNTIDASEVVSWKNGKVRFNNASLEEVLKQLARWYNVDIKYPDGIPNEYFTGGIDRNLNASEALEILKYMKVKFKIEGKSIIVSK